MDRIELVKVLDMVKPALAEKDYVPIFQHFIFDKKTVLAFNDRLCICIDLVTDLDAAVPGDLLLSFLKTGSAEQVDVVVKGGAAKFECGSFTFDLPVLDKTESIYSYPNKTKKIKVGSDFFAAVKRCLLSVDESNTDPKFSSVCYYPKDGLLYSTDGQTISEHYVAPVEYRGKGPIYLPYDFCVALLAIHNDENNDDPCLEYTNDCIIAPLTIGYVFAKQPVVEDPLDFEAVLDPIFDGLGMADKDVLSHMIEIPAGMESALKRAQLLVPSIEPSTHVVIKDGIGEIKTESGLGVVDDQLDIPDHNDRDVTLSATLVARGLAVCSHALITEDCTILSDGDVYFYYVANRN